MVREYSSNMPKFDKYGFTIFLKDSSYLDARQAEDSDDGEEMNAKAIRDLPVYPAEVRANYPKPVENAVAASTSQPSSSGAQPLNKENFDYSHLGTVCISLASCILLDVANPSVDDNSLLEGKLFES
jgi:hypothetical protein